jgi:glycosyltransferase involved in cell wall biosynthesis
MRPIKSGRRCEKSFRIVAIMTVRNEEAYLDMGIKHLINQGVEVCIVDNGSTDRSSGIIEQYLGKGVIRYEKLSYPGFFDLTHILKNEERLASEIKADWFIRQDADEIREAPPGYGTLYDAIRKVDALGYNAVNFDEFAFMPTDENESFIGKDFYKEMKYYCYIHPRPQHHIKAWKWHGSAVRLEDGGHLATFEGRRVYPENFILRHYIGLSADSLKAKYCGRSFRVSEILMGWHGERAFIEEDELYIPSKKELSFYDGERGWDRSDPRNNYPFFEKAHERIADHHPNKKPPAPFIVGSGGCGAALLRSMLDRHPLLAVPPETHLPYKLIARMGNGVGARKRFVNKMLENPRWAEFQLDAEHFRREILAMPRFTVSDGLRFFYASYAYRFRKPRWGESTPIYLEFVDKIARILPEAKFIHLIRDGRDVAVSIRNATSGKPEGIAKLAKSWRDRIRRTRKQAESLPHRYLEIRYEDLVSSPEAVLNKICGFVKLPYDDGMFGHRLEATAPFPETDESFPADNGDKGNSDRETGNASVFKPTDALGIGVWKKALSESEKRTVHKVAGALLNEFDYDVP